MVKIIIRAPSLTQLPLLCLAVVVVVRKKVAIRQNNIISLHISFYDKTKDVTAKQNLHGREQATLHGRKVL